MWHLYSRIWNLVIGSWRSVPWCCMHCGQNLLFFSHVLLKNIVPKYPRLKHMLVFPPTTKTKIKIAKNLADNKHIHFSLTHICWWTISQVQLHVENNCISSIWFSRKCLSRNIDNVEPFGEEISTPAVWKRLPSGWSHTKLAHVYKTGIQSMSLQ